jgi:hypothetical protein
MRTSGGHSRPESTEGGGGTCEDMESMRVRDTHALENAEGGTFEDTERKRARGALTGWKVQRVGQVRTQHENGKVRRNSHPVEERVEGGTSKDAA